ncbi:MAG: MarR family transcriptional regulator [Mycobacteriaceae bacterium]|nr:MarR family transcriptional regulator [Mycobacteriaceae bacterium]
MWLTDEQQRVWRGYLAMVGGLEAAMNRQLERDCGLSLADYEVLVRLSERGPQRVYEVAEALSWEQSRLSHQLRRMRDRGLVIRRASRDDRRGATIDITSAGSAALRDAAPGHVDLVRATVFDGMSAAELQAVGSLIDRVLARLATSPPRRSG